MRWLIARGSCRYSDCALNYEMFEFGYLLQNVKVDVHKIVYCSKVGALQDVRSELEKLRGILFYKVLEDSQSPLQ
ncbi:hypothetical protein IFM89_024875 [Coptis chinensis]|uniref:Uncharacterized protein n=1 Tax=Coptis chinensis TaxID=261450 RepID=A0A835LNG1_9MAGN|nr:hypothetical protein IFM89_024875 [Coptis chinensis]